MSEVRLIDAEALKEKLNKKALDLANGGMIFIESINHIIDNAPTVNSSLNLDNITEEDIENFKMIWQRANSKGLLVIRPSVEPCYQTTSCLDCGNYDKENHNCPRYCEVIKEAINEARPKGEWKITDSYPHKVYCDKCFKTYAQANWEVWKDGTLARDFCPNCGASMKPKANQLRDCENCVLCEHFGDCEDCKKDDED